MKFMLNIELDNAAMQTGQDVRWVLRKTGDTLPEDLTRGESGAIRDVNGNTVGRWDVLSEEDEQWL